MLILSFGFSANWFDPRQVLEPSSQQKLSLISGAETPLKFLFHLSLSHGSLCAVFSRADGQAPVDRLLQGIEGGDAVTEFRPIQDPRWTRWPDAVSEDVEKGQGIAGVYDADVQTLPITVAQRAQQLADLPMGLLLLRKRSLLFRGVAPPSAPSAAAVAAELHDDLQSQGHLRLPPLVPRSRVG